MINKAKYDKSGECFLFFIFERKELQQVSGVSSMQSILFYAFYLLYQPITVALNDNTFVQRDT